MVLNTTSPEVLMRYFSLLLVCLLSACSAVKMPTEPIFDPVEPSITPSISRTVVDLYYSSPSSYFPSSMDSSFSISLPEPLPLIEVLSILTSSENLPAILDLSQISNSKVSISYDGTISGFLQSLSTVYDFWYRWNGSALVFSDRLPVDIQIPAVMSSSDKSSLLASINSIGVSSMSYDNRVRILATPQEAEMLSGFLSSYTIKTIHSEVFLLSGETSDSLAIGLDPDRLQLVIGDAISKTRETLLSSAVGGFSLSHASPSVSLTSVLSAVNRKTAYRLTQSVAISSVSGSSSSVVLGTKQPYVSSVQLTSLSEGASSAVQTFEFSEAVDGLSLHLTPYASSDTVRVSGKLSLNRVLSMQTVGSGTSSITRPMTDSRDLTFDTIFTPGTPNVLLTFKTDLDTDSYNLSTVDHEMSSSYYAVLIASTIKKLDFALKTVEEAEDVEILNIDLED